MEVINTKKKVLSGLFWKLMERGGTQGIQVIVQIVLARLLLPEEFGVIALITIFMNIANVFVQSGFNTALIQKKSIDNLDYSSVFYLSLFIATILYTFLFFMAPFIADFYKKSVLIPVIRVLSIILFFGAVNSIQNAIVSRKMIFKRLFYSSLGGTTVSGIIGIVLAYLDFGVWALVAQQLTFNLLITLILWFTVKWRPQLLFSIERVKSLFSFGWKLLCSSLLDTVYQNVYGLVIGKAYSSEMLGYYNRGDQFPYIIVTNINGSIQSVLFPVLASSQDDTNRVKVMVRRSIQISSFIIFPMMIGLAAVAEPLVKVILTDKWIQCVPFLQALCLSYALWPVHTANLQAINALGRSDIFLKLELVKKIVGVVALCISLPFGVYVMVGSKVITSFISSLINAYPNRELLNYRIIEQWIDIYPSLLLSLVMGGIVYTIQFIGWNDWVTLIIQIVVGVMIYVGLARMFKVDSFFYLLDTLENIKKTQE